MGDPSPNTIISARGVSKKFASELGTNLRYCLQDICSDFLGLKINSQNLRKKEFFAVDNIDLDINAGDIIGVLGPNGSGKTTLMRMLSGIYRLDKGTIQHKNDIKITPIFALNHGIQPLFTGYENIVIKGAIMGMSKEEIEAKKDWIIEFSGIEHYLHAPAGSFSAGMRARLSYAVAMATDPDVFIIDEALAVGDIAFRKKCFDNLTRFVNQKNKAVIYVTQFAEKLENLGNRGIILKEGKIIFDSPDIQKVTKTYQTLMKTLKTNPTQ